MLAKITISHKAIGKLKTNKQTVFLFKEVFRTQFWQNASIVDAKDIQDLVLGI